MAGKNDASQVKAQARPTKFQEGICDAEEISKQRLER